MVASPIFAHSLSSTNSRRYTYEPNIHFLRGKGERRTEQAMVPYENLQPTVWGNLEYRPSPLMRPLLAMEASSSSSRPLANFHSTVWGDHFLSYTSQLTEITIQEKQEHDELKEKVRSMLKGTADSSTEKLELIDTIQRLGVAYHFHNEIDTSIQNIFDASSQKSELDEQNQLHLVALRFRLVRQQGHYMSSDVFKQFMEGDGNFKETLKDDVQALLNLYEAAHMRVHGEDIFEEALTFTTAHLESMIPILSNPLKAQIVDALKHPIQKVIPRLGARKYIDIYENMESHNYLLLKFSKLDFNMLQKQHQGELYKLVERSRSRKQSAICKRQIGGGLLMDIGIVFRASV